MPMPRTINSIMRTKIHTRSSAPALSPVPSVAMAIDSSRMASTSSTTAVASSPRPSLVRSTPSSSSVWAEMLTEVAASVTPTKIAASVE